FPYTTLFRSITEHIVRLAVAVKIGYCSSGCSSLRRTHQIVTNDVEINTLRRRSRDVGRLACANGCILDVRMDLGARGAQPITEIAARILIEVGNYGAAAVDREIT